MPDFGDIGGMSNQNGLLNMLNYNKTQAEGLAAQQDLADRAALRGLADPLAARDPGAIAGAVVLPNGAGAVNSLSNFDSQLAATKLAALQFDNGLFKFPGAAPASGGGGAPGAAPDAGAASGGAVPDSGGTDGRAGTASASVPKELLPFYQEASTRTGIPVDVLVAQGAQESGFRDVTGKAGEIGLHQIKPSTARDPGYGMTGIDPATLHDARTNINFAADYLKARAGPRADFSTPGGVDVALKNYNGGGDPNYVANVRARMAGASAVTAGSDSASAAPASDTTTSPHDNAINVVGQVAQTILAAPPEQRAALWQQSRPAMLAAGAVRAPADYPGDDAARSMAQAATDPAARAQRVSMLNGLPPHTVDGPPAAAAPPRAGIQVAGPGVPPGAPPGTPPAGPAAGPAGVDPGADLPVPPIPREGGDPRVAAQQAAVRQAASMGIALPPAPPPTDGTVQYPSIDAATAAMGPGFPPAPPLNALATPPGAATAPAAADARGFAPLAPVAGAPTVAASPGAPMAAGPPRNQLMPAASAAPPPAAPGAGAPGERVDFAQNGMGQYNTKDLPPGFALARVTHADGRVTLEPRLLPNVPDPGRVTHIEENGINKTYVGGKLISSVPTTEFDIANGAYKADRENINKEHGIADRLNTAQGDMVRLNEMRDVLHKINTGPGAQSQADAQAFLTRWLSPADADAYAARTANLSGPDAAQVFAKLATTGAGAMDREMLGSNAGFNGVKLFQGANPGMQLLNPANESVLGTQLIAKQVGIDLDQFRLDHFAQQEQRFGTDRKYTSIAQADRLWLSQRNPQVAAGAMGALAGQPPEKWAKGLSTTPGPKGEPSEYQRALDLVSRADPSATVNAYADSVNGRGNVRVSMQPNNGAPAPAAPVAAAPAAVAPTRPANVPDGSAYSASRNQWRSPGGQIYPGGP